MNSIETRKERVEYLASILKETGGAHLRSLSQAVAGVRAKAAEPVK